MCQTCDISWRFKSSQKKKMLRYTDHVMNPQALNPCGEMFCVLTEKE